MIAYHTIEGRFTPGLWTRLWRGVGDPVWLRVARQANYNIIDEVSA